MLPTRPRMLGCVSSSSGRCRQVLTKLLAGGGRDGGGRGGGGGRGRQGGGRQGGGWGQGGGGGAAGATGCAVCLTWRCGVQLRSCARACGRQCCSELWCELMSGLRAGRDRAPEQGQVQEEEEVERTQRLRAVGAVALVVRGRGQVARSGVGEGRVRDACCRKQAQCSGCMKEGVRWGGAME
eukprot:1065441-Rhodomonas_salina.2